MTSTPPIVPADLRARAAGVRERLLAAAARVIDSGWFLLGPETLALEEELSQWLGGNPVVATGSGTAALELALRALNVGPGDRVIAPSFTAVATVAAIRLVGATPVLVDVEPVRFGLDPNRVADTLADVSASVVLPVHLYGCPADLPRLAGCATATGALVLEDCAQAHGAAIDGRMVGTWGDAAAFSFYPTKNLGALGDAGAVTSRDPAVTARARILQQYGWRERYVSEEVGMNSRMDEIQAAFLRVFTPGLGAATDRRRAIAQYYRTELADTRLTLPVEPPGSTHVFHQFVVRTSNRDPLRAFLAERGVTSQVLYPVPVHRQPAYRDAELGAGGLPVTERVTSEILCLPIHAQLTDREIERVVAAVREWDRIFPVANVP